MSLTESVAFAATVFVLFACTLFATVPNRSVQLTDDSSGRQMHSGGSQKPADTLELGSRTMRQLYPNADKWTLALSDDGTKLASKGYVWRTSDGKVLARLKLESVNRPGAMRFTADGKKLLVAHVSGISLIDLASRKRTPQTATYDSCETISPDRRYAVCGTNTGKTRGIWIYDLKRRRKRYVRFPGLIEHVQFSANRRLLLQTESTLLVVSVPAGQRIARLRRKDGFTTARFRPQGDEVAFSFGEEVWRWRLKGKPERIKGPRGVVGYSPDGKLLVGPYGFWKLGTPTALLLAHQGLPLSRVAFSRTDARVFGVAAKVIRVWDLKGKRELLPRVTHEQTVTRLLFVGKQLLSYAKSGRLIRWNLRTGRGSFLTSYSGTNGAALSSNRVILQRLEYRNNKQRSWLETLELSTLSVRRLSLPKSPQCSQSWSDPVLDAEGRRLVFRSRDSPGLRCIFDLKTRQMLHFAKSRFDGASSRLVGQTFLQSHYTDGQLLVDVRSGSLLRVPEKGVVDISPNGRYLILLKHTESVVACFSATTMKRLWRKQFGKKKGWMSSLLAANNRHVVVFEGSGLRILDITTGRVVLRKNWKVEYGTAGAAHLDAKGNRLAIGYNSGLITTYRFNL